MSDKQGQLLKMWYVPHFLIATIADRCFYTKSSLLERHERSERQAGFLLFQLKKAALSDGRKSSAGSVSLLFLDGHLHDQV